jgi:arginyl-tRNA synthetase
MAERILLERGIAEQDNGAVLIDFKKHGAKNLDVALIRNRNGTSNYLLRDIGAAIQRQQTYNMDKMIYVVMSEQEAHLQRLFKILDLMGGEYAVLARKLQHVTFGKVRSRIFGSGADSLITNTLRLWECLRVGAPSNSLTIF